MSNLSQFLNAGATTAIINAHSSGGTQAATIQASGTQGSREVLSGALTAATLATLLTVDGPGLLPLLSVYTKDTTSRTVRLVVEVDGVTVFDGTSSAITTLNSGIFAAGAWTASGIYGPSTPIAFASSLVVRVASSLTETDKLAIAYILHRT
jgi:hypothetical protein